MISRRARILFALACIGLWNRTTTHTVSARRGLRRAVERNHADAYYAPMGGGGGIFVNDGNTIDVEMTPSTTPRRRDLRAGEREHDFPHIGDEPFHSASSSDYNQKVLDYDFATTDGSSSSRKDKPQKWSSGLPDPFWLHKDHAARNFYIARRYAGIDMTEYGGPAPIPPDPMGAAGPRVLCAVVNVQIECRNKNNGQRRFHGNLTDFYTETNVTTPYDPKIVYDVHEGRFVVMTLNRGEGQNQNSRIELAVSKTNDPRGIGPSHWNFVTIDSVIETRSADYPGFEVDKTYIYVTANMYPLDIEVVNTIQVRVWVIDKFPFYKGGNATFRHSLVPSETAKNSNYTNIAITAQPAEMRGAGLGFGSGTLLVSRGPSAGNDTHPIETLDINLLTDPTKLDEHGRLVSESILLELDRKQDSFAPLPDAPQRGQPYYFLSTNDRRILDAAYHDGFLWVVSEVLMDGKTLGYYLKIAVSYNGTNFTANLADGGPIQGVDIGTVGAYTFFPSVAVNKNGVAAFGFSASGPDIFGSAYVTHRMPSFPPGQVGRSLLVAPGVAGYKRVKSSSTNRWGDYSGIAVDPTDENVFWVFNEFASAKCRQEKGSYGLEDGCWSTRWAKAVVGKKTPPKPARRPKPSSSKTKKHRAYVKKKVKKSQGNSTITGREKAGSS